MIATEDRTEQRFVLHDISWDGYESLLREIGDRHLRMTYDNGDLEFMTLSFGHENAGEWIGRLIFFLAVEWRVPICSGGSTTLKKAIRKKGLEPDRSFWIANERALRGKKDWDAQNDPPPDLVVEVDITRSSLNRLGIYSALGVPEVWRYDGRIFSVLSLTSTGRYTERTKSLAFPALPLKSFAGYVARLGTEDEVELIRSFCKWVRSLKVK
jgi:Uma2 family endonuclease